MKASDTSRYLDWLDMFTSTIDIRGLTVGTGGVYRFPIRELYVPLMTAGRAEGQGRPREARLEEERTPRAVRLEEALSEPRLVILGDPGSGKTTFLRRIAYEWRRRLGGMGSDFNLPGGAAFPLFIEKPSELLKFIDDAVRSGARLDRTAPEWVSQFFGSLKDDREKQWGLDAQFFASKLQREHCVLLIDGMDEAPDQTSRTRLSKLIRRLARAYPRCRIVVTSRPPAYTGGAVLADEPGDAGSRFFQVHIGPLEDEAIQTFMQHWSTALCPDNAREAELRAGDLMQAVRATPEIRRLARNPVMLTALAVLQWNEQRMPEHRRELYDSIINWLLRSRLERSGAAPGGPVLELLQILALKMQNHASGRQVQIPQGEAAEMLKDHRTFNNAARLVLTALNSRGPVLNELRRMAEQAAGDPVVIEGVEIDSGVLPRLIELLTPGAGRPAGKFAEGDERALRHTLALGAARAFVSREEIDSGIIVGRGEHVRFWHLTFQEFLAARAIAPHPPNAILLDSRRNVYRPEWREVVLLLASELCVKAFTSLDYLVQMLLDDLSSKASLANQARTFGLVGAIVSDVRFRGYQVDESVENRIESLKNAVLAIFDRRASETVPIEVRIEAADALGQGDPRLDPGGAGYWISIPAGTFWMGAQKRDRKGRNYDAEAEEGEWAESPVHEVYLDRFEIGRYPVTVMEYSRFMAEREEVRIPERWEEQLQHPSRPVVYVTWFEAKAYCAWLSAKENAVRKERAVEIRLPTEAEWEYAARRTEGRKYPWGDELPDAARLNFNNNIGYPTPVGVYPAGSTPDGVSDMAGNVWEWCEDYYGEDYYRKSPGRNPRGPATGSVRVVRGGSWDGIARDCRSAFRLRGYPEDRLDLQGFRLVRVCARTP